MAEKDNTLLILGIGAGAYFLLRNKGENALKDALGGVAESFSLPDFGNIALPDFSGLTSGISGIGEGFASSLGGVVAGARETVSQFGESVKAAAEKIVTLPERTVDALTPDLSGIRNRIAGAGASTGGFFSNIFSSENVPELVGGGGFGLVGALGGGLVGGPVGAVAGGTAGATFGVGAGKVVEDLGSSVRNLFSKIFSGEGGLKRTGRSLRDAVRTSSDSSGGTATQSVVVASAMTQPSVASKLNGGSLTTASRTNVVNTGGPFTVLRKTPSRRIVGIAGRTRFG